MNYGENYAFIYYLLNSCCSLALFEHLRKISGKYTNLDITWDEQEGFIQELYEYNKD